MLGDVVIKWDVVCVFKELFFGQVEKSENVTDN